MTTASLFGALRTAHTRNGRVREIPAEDALKLHQDSRPAPTPRPRPWTGVLGEPDPGTGIWPGLLGRDASQGREKRR